jgi:hypothetical protein
VKRIGQKILSTKKLKASALKVLEFPETVQTLILEIICFCSMGFADYTNNQYYKKTFNKLCYFGNSCNYSIGYADTKAAICTERPDSNPFVQSSFLIRHLVDRGYGFF